MSSKISSPAVLHVLTSQSYGGLEIYTLSLIKKLLDDHVKTALYCLPGSKIALQAQQLNIPLYYGYNQARFSVKDFFYLLKIMRLDKFQILHSHARQDVWICSFVMWFLKNKKHVFSLYMTASHKKNFFYKFIYFRLSAIISSSKTLNKLIQENYPIPSEKIKLLRYGRDLSLYKKDPFQAEKIRAMYGVKKMDIVVGTMCRIDPAKGVKEIAESLLFLSEQVKQKIKIWIIGEPTLLHLSSQGTPLYEKKAKELFDWLVQFSQQPSIKDHFELIPFQHDFIAYLSAMDIFVLATYRETYSLAVLDAMAMALPVIGTNSGGTPEQVVDQVRGLLVQPCHPQDLANAITTYVQNPQLRWQHGKNGKRWVFQEHSWEKNLQQLQHLYSRIMEE
jgi:D-inositol-3-phosphate glycosyltransferase